MEYIFWFGGVGVKKNKEFHVWHAQKVAENYVFDFWKELVDYCESEVKYGRDLFNPDGAWSEGQMTEFGERMAADYFASDSQYFPREIFDFEKMADIPEGH